jgi:hypothetical protein
MSDGIVRPKLALDTNLERAVLVAPLRAVTSPLPSYKVISSVQVAFGAVSDSANSR